MCIYALHCIVYIAYTANCATNNYYLTAAAAEIMLCLCVERVSERLHNCLAKRYRYTYTHAYRDSCR